MTDRQATDWLESYRRRVEAGELGTNDKPDPYQPDPIPWPADWPDGIAAEVLSMGPEPQISRFARLALSLRLGRYLRELAMLHSGQLEPNDFYRRALLQWANRDAPHHGIILLGGEGSGKSVTALALCLGTSIAGQGWDFLDAGEFADIWSNQDFTRIGQLKTVGLLVIDEIGDCEDIKGNPFGLLKRVINSRYRDDLPTALATTVAGKTVDGIDVPELRKAIGSEVVDRFPERLRIKTRSGSFRT
jgi:hypothetical protein